MKVVILLFVAGMGLTACSFQHKEVARLEDVEHLLVGRIDSVLMDIDDEISFWQERGDLTGLLKMAGLYSTRFDHGANIQNILTSDSLYMAALSMYNEKTPEVFQGLAINSITKHNFQNAWKNITVALELGYDMGPSSLILFDVEMELGKKNLAKGILKQFKSKHSFPYLIRLAKLKDQEGQLQEAILIMEKALEKVPNDRNLYCWTKSTLGDMYGHAGRIQDSYQAYLDVLDENPTHSHSLKGIAWIAFSHDSNEALARTIINHLYINSPSPEYELFLARIAETEGDSIEKYQRLDQFSSHAREENYGVMYSKYLAVLEAEEFSRPERAIEIAEQEIKNRACAQSYDLLAWGYYNKGDYGRALEITERWVDGLTYEPEILYHMGMIYLKNNKTSEGLDYLSKALDSSFELGPTVKRKIKEAIEK